MSVARKFVKETMLYGLATVLPRLMNFILVPLHTDTLPTNAYSDNTTFYIYAAFFNVLLAYGMETAFFRFFSKSEEKSNVFTTVLISLTVTAVLFFAIVMFNSAWLAEHVQLKLKYFQLLIGVLALDALVVAPFAYLRATGKAKKFTFVKLLNITTYVVLNFYFLWYLPNYQSAASWFQSDDLVQYIFMANVVASLVTFMVLLPHFFKYKLHFDTAIFKQLWRYGWPVMVAGLAYIINENFDKWIIPLLIDKSTNGAYSGCYKLAVFMTIFIQAFRLGAEPFFFNYAKNKNAPKTYAMIMKYFVIAGAMMLMVVIGFIDVFKELLIRDESYWIAIDIVPIVLLANLFLGIYFNLAIWYKLTDRTRVGMYISIAGALLTIAFNIYFIPIWGFIAAAWATLVAYGVMMIVSYSLGKKYYPIPYNLKKIGIYIGVAVLLSAISYLEFRTNYYIGIAMLLLFTIMVWIIEKNELKKFVQKG